MVSCPRCGANIDPSALVCPYCQTQTYYGKQQAERQAAYQAHAAQAEHARLAQEQQQRRLALAKKSQHAMIWSVAGMFTCCFPAAIVGIVMGLNVKGAAKRDNAVAPGSSTVAVVLGVCALALFGVGAVMYVHDSRKTEARIGELSAQVNGASASETIDQRLACALTELELLKEGFAGTGGINISGFECSGKLEQSAERAKLSDVRFRTSSSERRTVAACLFRGARWSVKELREDGSCEPKPALSAPVPAPSAP